MDTMLVRLKPHDPRRGNVLKRYTYRGIRFEGERGWYRVGKEVAEYLRGVRQAQPDPLSPPAFDVCTDDEAKAIDEREKREATQRASATDRIEVTPARGAVTTSDLPDGGPKGESRGKRERT